MGENASDVVKVIAEGVAQTICGVEVFVKHFERRRSDSTTAGESDEGSDLPLECNHLADRSVDCNIKESAEESDEEVDQKVESINLAEQDVDCQLKEPAGESDEKKQSIMENRPLAEQNAVCQIME